jgi:hypothetical protein
VQLQLYKSCGELTYRIRIFDALLSLHMRLTGIDAAGSLHAQHASMSVSCYERLLLVADSNTVLLEHIAPSLIVCLLCAQLQAQMALVTQLIYNGL